MEYITKTCPICGREFTILKKAEEKAIYCTIKCLSEAQGMVMREKVPLIVAA